ncbi:Autophagy protein 22 [Puccinia graminis f. sp. tritici]|uniref:Autophagy-related protein n=1 Tax=Puccinia graminis f. sp. tritici TaxID=56615 RepID=A0A5B0ME37_PUCGR|nr:Autophagy protein 22 [Puccinia graminis f. sp. tritici]
MPATMVMIDGRQSHEERRTSDERFVLEDDEAENDKLELTNLIPSPAVPSKFLLAEEEGETPAGPWGLWGFYSYSFASEVFAIVSAGLFMPITLEQLARDNGYAFPDHQAACSGSLKATPANQASPSDFGSLSGCEVKLLGNWIDTASFPLYVFSISVAIQAFVVASLGDAADNPIMRKFLLILFAGIGSLSGILFFFLDSGSSLWSLTAILAILANVALGVSGVCLNSFIPNLAKATPKVLEAQRDLIRHHPLSSSAQDEHYKTLISTATANISSNGIALGCGSGIIALCLSLIVIISHDGNTDSLRWVIGLSGIWWAFFSIPAVFLLPPRRSAGPSGIVNPFNPAKSIARYLSMLKEYKQLKNTIRFLMAWFFLSDAFSTLTSTAVLFAKTTLEMTSSHLILIGVIVPTTGIIGALIAPRIQQKLQYCSGLNGSLKMFKLLIGFSCLVPGYVSITLVFGIPVLTTEAEMFVLAGVFGLFYGAFQSYARSVYSELIPPGHEAKWYALYSITDKSSSFFGPLVVGLISDYTHNIRFGFLFILLVLVLSFPILNHVDVPSGKLKAEEYSRTAKQ